MQPICDPYPLILEMKRVAESGGKNAEWLRQAYLAWYYQGKSILDGQVEGVDEETKALFRKLVYYASIYYSFDHLFFRFAHYFRAEADMPMFDDEFTHRADVGVRKNVTLSTSHVFERLLCVWTSWRSRLQQHVQKAGRK